ncbi:single-stranded DNA-binding protein [Photobacterium sp. SDRW27]|uniref:single-stranded DNA-binding protein n=1 Tax=Photobacterium obscurum TaxID=2829490 RepID=UPI002243DB82|nr:single-stranded DNA-binding protein [Photobacterium obscurum]MCW8329403.1 single-stranded DNA-binding protein [Photobacterium obscurum]
MENQCVQINEQGFLFASPEPITECTGYVLVSHSTYDSFITDITINPVDIASSFTFGFAAVIITGYFAAYPVGIAKALIRKL